MKKLEGAEAMELPVARRGRKPIGDRPMTAAERKARSRALVLGGIVSHIELAVVALEQLRQAVKLEGAAAEAFIDLELQLSLARSLVPNS
jgi:hypothetical protein